MSAAKKEAESGEVHCRRLGRSLPTVEHLRCPYCYGAAAEVKSEDHDRFCDFEAGRDPIVFGFPPESSRYRNG